MHGRKRVDPSSESVEKKTQRLTKIEKYKALSSVMFEKRQEKVYDVDTLNMCDTLLAVNPELYTLWAYRKEAFIYALQQQHSKDKEQIEALTKVELEVVEKALKRNPKSYVAWHHRVWMIEHGAVDLKRELQLCNQFLSIDSRNCLVHCWNYRRFVVSKSGEPLMNEFNYTTKHINQNFSNYSAWHYRSVLLEKIGARDPDFFKNQIPQEFEMLQSAFYTEPDDQSAWLYHRWLLSKISPLITAPSNFHHHKDTDKSPAPSEYGDIERLKKELTTAEELLTAEPNCKWALLTVAVLVLALDKAKVDTKRSKDNLLSVFQHVIKLDPMRKGYFESVLKSLQ